MLTIVIVGSPGSGKHALADAVAHQLGVDAEPSLGARAVRDDRERRPHANPACPHRAIDRWILARERARDRLARTRRTTFPASSASLPLARARAIIYISAPATHAATPMPRVVVQWHFGNLAYALDRDRDTVEATMKLLTDLAVPALAVVVTTANQPTTSVVPPNLVDRVCTVAEAFGATVLTLEGPLHDADAVDRAADVVVAAWRACRSA